MVGCLVVWLGWVGWLLGESMGEWVGWLGCLFDRLVELVELVGYLV